MCFVATQTRRNRNRRESKAGQLSLIWALITGPEIYWVSSFVLGVVVQTPKPTGDGRECHTRTDSIHQNLVLRVRTLRSKWVGRCEHKNKGHFLLTCSISLATKLFQVRRGNVLQRRLNGVGEPLRRILEFPQKQVAAKVVNRFSEKGPWESQRG